METPALESKIKGQCYKEDSFTCSSSNKNDLSLKCPNVLKTYSSCITNSSSNCALMPETSERYSENGMKCLLNQFKQLYEEKLMKIENNKDDSIEFSKQKLEMKLEVFKSWLHDLEEQNDLLIQTLNTLEIETYERVVMLETRLQKTSALTKEYMLKLRDYEQQMQTLSVDKFRAEKKVLILEKKLSELENSAFAHDESSTLFGDIKLLFEFLNNHYQFTKIQPLTLKSLKFQTPFLEGLLANMGFTAYNQDGGIHKSCSCPNIALNSNWKMLENSIETLMKSSSKSVNLNSSYLNENYNRSETVEDKPHNYSTFLPVEAMDTLVELKKCVENKQMSGASSAGCGHCNLSASIARKDKELSDAQTKINCLYKHMISLKKHSDEIRNILSVEIAERHDVITSLRESLRKQAQLTEDTKKQLNMKIEVIKELRKEIKLKTDQLTKCSLSRVDLVTPEANVIDKLQNKLTEKQTLLDEMKKHLETSQTEIELKDDTVKNLENKLTNTRLDLSSMERKNRDLEETVMSLNKSLETARAYQESLMRNCEMKSVMMMDLQESNSNNILKEENTQHQLDVLQKDNEHLKEKLLTMEKECIGYKVTVLSLQEALVASKKENDELKNHCSSDTKSLSSLSQDSGNEVSYLKHTDSPCFNPTVFDV